MQHRLLSIGLAGVIASLLTTVAVASPIGFSIAGGNNAPVVFTLAAPVKYTVTVSPSDLAPIFAFRGVGDLFAATWPGVSGSMTYSINGGPSLTLNTVNSGIARQRCLADRFVFLRS